MPVGAWALVAGCATGFATVHIALDRACSRHYECDASHPTLSMTLRHGDVRRNVVPMLLASSVCLLFADCALWATCCSDQRGGGLISTHAALLAGSTGAIGSALARLVIAGGGTPLLFGRNSQLLRAQAAELGGLEYRVADLFQPETVGPALKELPSDLRGVAYAAGSVTLKPLRGATPDDFATSLALNAISAAETGHLVLSTLHFLRVVEPVMG